MLIQPIFIVAQYKCGTSWLLSTLCAHPDLVGVGEIDVVRMTSDVQNGVAKFVSAEKRSQRFFGKNAWCSQNVIPALVDQALPEPRPSKLHKPQRFQNIDRDVAYQLYQALQDVDDPKMAVDQFLTAVTRVNPAASHVVLKGADQISHFDILQSWYPQAKKIAITRDGRSAAISAIHYRKLVENAPWFAGHQSFEHLLSGWRSRAKRLIEEAKNENLYLLRYEDLTLDFEATFTKLLTWLELHHTPKLVNRINQQTKFETRTGRERGSEGNGIIRKGSIDEWVEALTAEEKERAWEIAHGELAALGYTESGILEPLSLSY